MQCSEAEAGLADYFFSKNFYDDALASVPETGKRET